MNGVEVKLEAPRPPPPAWRVRLACYLQLIRADRPIGILLLLWPTLWALWVAGGGNPPWGVVLVFVLVTAVMRSAGCAINDYADRAFDGHVARTCRRPVPAGKVTPREALGVFAALSLVAFGLVLFLNATTVLMSFVALGLAAIYPFTKRWTHWPQAVLGLAFGWAIPMAFTAIQGSVPPVGWALFVATVVWALIYDTEYAMVDRDDDLRIGIKSTAIFFGRHDRLAIGLLQLLMLGLLAWVGVLAGRGAVYYAGLGLGGLLFAHQQWQIRDRDPKRCFKAFLDNNQFGMVVFFSLLLDYLLVR
jgi:4-hydroxybenzoate polyprenyltransferase